MARTTFVNPEIERLQKELSLLTEQKKSLDSINREKQKESGKKEIVMVHGTKYVINGTQMEKIESTPKPTQHKKGVCLTFCKYGSCSVSSCPNIHDKSIVRICPAFLKVRVYCWKLMAVGMLSK